MLYYNITISGISKEDFINFKKPSMFIGFPYCSMKCEKECKKHICQNEVLLNSKKTIVSVKKMYEEYVKNDITESIVCGGLEPFDSFEDLYSLVEYFRSHLCNDVFVIYTGYYKNEIEQQINKLSMFKNIIVKFGRYIPNHKSHYDDVLGVNLASDNQYAERIS